MEINMKSQRMKSRGMKTRGMKLRGQVQADKQKINTRNWLVFLLASSLTLLLASCGSAGKKGIEEADKDQSGSYDGLWTANIQRSPVIQYGPGNWTFRCSGKTGKFNFRVKDGVANFYRDSTAHQAFVDADGNFRFEVPLKVEAKAAGTSDSSIDQGKMTQIFGGSLKDKKGLLVWGIAQFANDGCKSKIEYSKG